MSKTPEELFEKIMKDAPVYPSSTEALLKLKLHLQSNNLDYRDWRQIKVSRPTKLNMERLPIGHSFCLTYHEFEKVGRKRFDAIVDDWRRRKDKYIKIAIIKHRTLLVYEIARLW